MATLYITSTETFAGKSAVCIGLGTQFVADGFRFAYMKPISHALALVDGQLVDEDVRFIQNTFQLPQPTSVLNPIAVTRQMEELILRGEQPADFLGRLREAYAQAAAGQDIVLLEAGVNLREGFLIGLPATRLVTELNAGALVIVRHSNMLVDDVLAAQQVLGASLFGVVLNAVPRPQLDYVRAVVRPFLQRRGVRVWGVLPQEQLLQAISVRDLAVILDGQVACCPDAGEELVERFMIGAMGVQAALSYFRRQANKAVITGGDRPDIQLAALETSTRCLILTGNMPPAASVLRRAEQARVPIIVVRHDTMTTVEIIDQFFGKTRFRQEKKIQRFARLLAEHFDYPGFYKALGLRN